MPVPKRKRSKSRRDSRHANWGLKMKTFTQCQQCQHPLANHQACPECGYYKGVKVMRTKDERTKSRSEVRQSKEALKKEASRHEVKEGEV